MGFFGPKLGADGLPVKINDLYKATDSAPVNKKYDPRYAFRCMEKMLAITEEKAAQGDLGKGFFTGQLDAECLIRGLVKLPYTYRTGNIVWTHYDAKTGKATDEKIPVCEPSMKNYYRCYEALCLLTRTPNLPGDCLEEVDDFHLEAARGYKGGYLTGKPDPEMALKRLHLAMNLSFTGATRNPAGVAALAVEEMMTYPIKPDPTHIVGYGFKMCEKGWDSGYKLCRDGNWLGELDLDRMGVSPEGDFAVYEAGAKQGNPYAIYMLARCYEKGLGTEKRLKVVVPLLETAAELGCCTATSELIYIHNGFARKYMDSELEGDPTKEAKFKALHEQQLAALKGILADLLRSGSGASEQPRRREAVERDAAPEGPCVREMPYLITDDLWRTWVFQSLSIGLETATYRLENFEELTAGEFSAEVQISNRHLNGRTARVGSRSFHW